MIKSLPLLGKGNMSGYPRIFAIALELLSHTDGRFTREQLMQFVDSYQKWSTLSMSELWALSPMLKLALIEKIRCCCERIENDQRQWEKAEKLRGLISSGSLDAIR
jgi:cyclic beta-1,2-glucan synthetase